MKKTGFVGWRGMVGSVLLERMRVEGDFRAISPVFFSTSQAGKPGPGIGRDVPPLQDAYDIRALAEMDIIISCQGGDYTARVHPELRNAGWQGFWIDAASTLRMEKTSVIVLDPVNRDIIEQGLVRGVKDYIGGNCTVSLMLMALAGLFKHNLVEWLSSMTYQAVSGAGARKMIELIRQMGVITEATLPMLDQPSVSILDIDRRIARLHHDPDFPVGQLQVPLAASLIPWIDRPVDNGQTREEWKAMAETNKILGTASAPVPIDGCCVRIGTMRCHSQAFTIKLRRDIPLADIEGLIGSAHPWVSVVANESESTLRKLTPARVSGSLDIPVGRIRKMKIGPKTLTAFTVGDQLLWGAAEPLRRILTIILE